MVSVPALTQVRRIASALTLLTSVAVAQETTRVSVDSSGAEANGDCNSIVLQISADGMIVAFASNASNLVAGDNNARSDVFVHDRATGITERVSVDSSGKEGWDDAWGPSISADGRFVAFTGAGSNLVPGDTNLAPDIFVHDRVTGITERVSVDSSGAEGNGNCHSPTISANGQFVTFSSVSSNLVANDTNGHYDVFVHDRSTGTTERVSIRTGGTEANGDSFESAMSTDGQIIAFQDTATNLVAGDSNGCADIFVHDRSSGISERVSVDSSGTEGNGHSRFASISADGQIVAFESDSSNLIAHDTNYCGDIFIHDRSTGETRRVSVDSSGVEGNAPSDQPSISAEGQFVAFHSRASNFVAGDMNYCDDVFVRNRTTRTIERVSVNTSGAEGTSYSQSASISADGQIVAFRSNATDLVANDTNGFIDVFVHEHCTLAASWSNYGAGFPGTNGTPNFTSRQNPVLGTTITLDLDNSYGSPTAGLLLVGFQRTYLHSKWGGDFLVLPTLVIPLTFSYSGDAFTGDIPNDRRLCGIALDLQAIESDPGAAKGVSFTPGLELLLGK
jgi:Tol biopolymer transport system component